MNEEKDNIQNELIEIVDKLPIDDYTADFLEDTLNLIIEFTPVLKGALNFYRNRKIKKALKILKEKISQIENPNSDKFRELFISGFENVVNEKQEEKIEYIINIIVNGTNDSMTSIDKSLIYLSLLERLTFMEIDVLTSFYQKPDFNKRIQKNPDKLDELNITQDMYRLITINLQSLGLIKDTSMNDIRSFAQEIIEYTKYLNRGKYNYHGISRLYKPKIIEQPTVFLSVTGKEFIDFIIKIK